jgi:hypothetical protein
MTPGDREQDGPAAGQPPEAVEVPPKGEGNPQPEVLVYAAGRKPIIQVCLGGQWRTAVVRERHNYPNGTAYQVTLDPGTGRHVVRTYWWSPGLRILFTPPK